MRVILWALPCAIVFAQSPEGGRVDRNGNQATLTVDSGRPLDSAAITLAEKYGIRVNVEDPPYMFSGDVKDVTAEVSRAPNPRRRVLVPKGGHLELPFAVRADGRPEDIPGMLRDLVVRANAQFPFQYRLDVDGDWATLIPTHTRDAQGRAVEITPLMDRRVTIPPGTRMIAESANLMASELSAQAGLRVSCCQSSVGGIPWGMPKISFEAHEEPARSVLKRLIVSSLEGQRNGYYWLLRCDPLPSGWCFINLMYARVSE